MPNAVSLPPRLVILGHCVLSRLHYGILLLLSQGKSFPLTLFIDLDNPGDLCRWFF